VSWKVLGELGRCLEDLDRSLLTHLSFGGVVISIFLKGRAMKKVFFGFVTFFDFSQVEREHLPSAIIFIRFASASADIYAATTECATSAIATRPTGGTIRLFIAATITPVVGTARAAIILLRAIALSII
jgi:hypothetical protein